MGGGAVRIAIKSGKYGRNHCFPKQRIVKKRPNQSLDEETHSYRPRSEIKYQQKNHCGEVLNFFLTEDHKTTLTFCQVIILFYPITGSQITH